MTELNAATHAAPPKKFSRYVFTLLFLLYTFDYIDRMIVSSLFPFIQRDWGITDAQCGMLISAVYWSIIIFTLPASFLVDRWSRKKSIGLMALLWSFATVACAFTKNFRHLFSARVAIGIGEAGYAPGGTAMISALFPQEKRAQVMGLWNASIPLGSAVGIILGGLVAEQLGWRHAFGLVALPGLIVSVLFFFVRDYVTVELSKPNTPGSDPSALTLYRKFSLHAKTFAKTRSLLLTYFGFSANTFVTTAMMAWLPTYFHRLDGSSMSEAGIKSGSVLITAIIGAPLGGYLADRWLSRRANARLLLPACTSFASCLLLFLSFRVLHGTAQYVTLLLSGVTVAAFVPSAAAVTQDVVHPGLRAMSYGLCVIVQNLLGSSLGPIFIGMVSDSAGIEHAMATLPFFSAAAGILFLIGSFFYVGDTQKADKVPLQFEA